MCHVPQDTSASPLRLGICKYNRCLSGSLGFLPGRAEHMSTQTLEFGNQTLTSGLLEIGASYSDTEGILRA